MSLLLYHKTVSLITMSVIPFMFTINGDFVFDDSEAIVNNQDVTSGPWFNVFSHDFWGTNITSDLSHKSYRPLTILTFRLNYLINSKSLSAYQFKVTNLACHSLSCILLWAMTDKIIARTKFLQTSRFSIDIPYSTGLLFSVHPIHSEAVCGIVGRADILAAATFFLSFIFYEKAMDDTGYKYLYILKTILLAGCSMLFKENGITVLGFCIVYELIVNLKFNDNRKINLSLNSFIRIFIIIIAAVCLLYARWTVMGGTKPTFKPTDNPASFSDDTFVKVATYSYIYFLNALLLIWPEWLCYDWSMGCIRLIRSIEDSRCFWVIILYGLSFIYVTNIFRPYIKASTKRVLLVAISLIIIPFLPASNILYPVGFVIAERILYISSAGYCLIICLSLEKIFQVEKLRLVSLIFFLLLVMFYGGRTWQRSKDWKNEYNLFLSGMSVCPMNAKIHYNVAKVVDANNMTSWARQEYEEAIRLNPEYYQAMNNLANLLKNEKKFNEAEMYLKTAIHYKPDFPAAWMNLGIVYANTKRYQEAIDAYKTAIKYRNNYPDCYYNIGNLVPKDHTTITSGRCRPLITVLNFELGCKGKSGLEIRKYLELNNTEEAMKHWYKAIELKPRHDHAWTNMISLLDNIGHRAEALQLLPKALKIRSDSASINFVAANIYGKVDDFEEAEKYFLKAIALYGTRVQAVHYANLGVLYHRWKKFDSAEEMYNKALKLEPRSGAIARNLKKLLKSRKS